MAQAKVTFALLAENTKVEMPVVGSAVRVGSVGWESIRTVTGTVSTTHDQVAARPTLPAGSIAETVKRCEPSGSLVKNWPPRQGWGSLSTVQANVDPCSSELNANVATGLFVGLAGPRAMVTMGGTVSTVQIQLDGWPTFPAASVAETVRLWAPSGMFVYV
jgi:hypothetical protein